MNQFASLTQASLIAALEEVAQAGNDTECGVAIASAAALLQEAVLGEQDPKEVTGSIEAVPTRLAPHLATVVDRAVSFSLLDDDSTLGLWLVPVVLSLPDKLPSIVPLETSTMNGLKATAYLQAQLGLNKVGGWTYVLPALFSLEQIRQADLHELITLPHQAQAVVRGERSAVEFGGNAGIEGSQGGPALYFLPFVAKHPAGVDIGMPHPCERVLHRLTKWVTDSLDGRVADLSEVAVHVGPQPHAFSAALPVGERLQLDVKVREMLTEVCDQAQVHPNGLAALVAPYVTRQMNDEYVLGISLVSRLTGAFVATLSLVIDFDDKDGFVVGMAARVLEEMGMQVIQLRHEPISTITCQHCGHLQYAIPHIPQNHGEAMASTKVQ